ncbi:hypothetical protein DEFDS_1152 [Deferribacter desulfuricans SSM1]|uniref:Uncharacterized protein n=1 Tax=Deferribacter desulfuricans (strain DSM 14783 / JCM 11476 / NBRC 101012 / SSM1) TaxID=639282 RepID=D3PDE8_DEFDS|nr:DUF6701 domain-containing protein [Deferribacter desulfuricans]BAI80621.1 hypothetical protein DEFDS_1152 [Deferribacter desulfuricans SSM1]
MNRNIPILKLILIVLFSLIYNLNNVFSYDYEVTAANNLTCAGSRTNQDLNCNAGEFTTIVDILTTGKSTTCVEGQSLSIDIILTLKDNKAERYDIGFFVGENNNDPRLQTGQCSVATFDSNQRIFDSWIDVDHDSCSDFEKNGNSTVKVNNVIVSCIDNDGDGSLDVPYTVVYQQNKNNSLNCSGPQNVSSGSKSKCNFGYAAINDIIVLPKPIADYYFDECSWDGTPGEVKDSSGNNHNATAQNNANVIDNITAGGGIYRVANFNGKYITIDEPFQLPANYTTTFWLKFPLIGSQSQYTYQGYKVYIIGSVEGTGDIGFFMKDNNGNYRFAVYDNNGNVKEIDLPSLSDGWHFFAIKVENDKTKLYIDGNSQEYSVNIATYGALSIIGSSTDFTKDETIGNYMDEFKIFDSLLTQNQIEAIYNNEKAGKNWDGTEREPINCTCTPEYDGIVTPIEFEGGRFTTTNTYNNKTWDHITFQKPFREPPAVFVVIDKTGGHAASARMKNITKTGFDITIVEPPGYDGPHISQSLSYLAINKGVHKLGNQYIEVGEINTKKVQGKYTPNGSIIGWEKVTTKVNFCDPAVVANIQTLNNLNSSDPQKQPPYKALIPWSTAVIDNITSNSFNLALDMSETNDGLINKDETVAYMVSEGNIQDSFVDDDNNTILYETIKTQPYFEGWSNNCNTVSFKNNYSKTPLIAGWKNSRKEDDGGWFRICSLDKNKVGFVVDEDKDHDSERSHIKESGSIFVFSDNFVKREIILDHYLIEHDGVGLTCQPEKVTIKACTDNATSCTEYTSTTDVTLNYNSTPQNYSFTGETKADVIHHDAGTITLSLTNMNPIATNGYKCYNTTTGLDSCDITFYDSGFIFDIKNTYSYKPQDVTIKAVRKDDQTQACVPAFQNTSLDINFTFDNLSANPTNTAPEIDNITLPNNITLNFDNNGAAIFNVVYKEAGKLSFTATYDNGTVYAVGSDTAVFKPFGFYVYTTDNNWQADNGANSTVFKKAGENFNLTVKAVGWQSDTDTDLSDNPVTKNYQENNIPVTHTLVAPSGGNNGTIGVTSLDFTNGITSIANQTFSEVGIIKFTVTDNDFLGAGSITGTSANIGRFIPDHFIIKSKTNGVLNDNGNFIYTGQTVTYLTKPEFIIEAQNKDNQTTKNYSGDFFKLDIGGISIIDPTTDDKTTGNDGNLLSVNINRAIATFTINNDGSATYTFGDDNITYIRDNNSKVAPFIPQLTFKINSIIDNDSVSGINLPDNISVTGSEMRYGRLKIYDNYGPETEDLELDIETQYWDGKYWVLNTDDSHYSLSINDFKLDNYTDKLNSGNSLIDNVTGISEGKGSLHLTTPGENNYGTVDICIDTSSIIYNYLNDNESCGTATFGIYRGRDIIIDWQEIPPQ